MKNHICFWKKRKVDEMEALYRYKAGRNAYLFLVFSLGIWSFWEGFKGMKYSYPIHPLPAILLGMASLIQLFSQWIFERNAVKDDEDSFETTPLRKLAFGIFVIILIFLFFGYSFLYMSVRA